MPGSIKCPKCGADNNSEANFCSICGGKLIPSERIDQSNEFNSANAAAGMPRKKKSRILKFGLIAAAVIIIGSIILKPDPNNVMPQSASNDEDTETVEAFDHKEAEKKLSSKVTKDYLPGTYKSSDGKYFAIKVTDESVLNITMPGLAKIFNPDLSSFCYVFKSENGWLEELGDVYVTQDELILTSETYSYELSGTTLKLTNDDSGETVKYKKISDDYKPNLFMDKSSITADNIEGIYLYNLSVNDGNYNRILKIDKVSDSIVNIYCYYYIGNLLGEISQMQYAAENVPVSEFVGGKRVYLKSENDCIVDSIIFVTRTSIEDEGTVFSKVSDNSLNDELQSIESLKTIAPDINYDYSSFDDVVTAKYEKIKFVYNNKWYRYCKQYKCEGYAGSDDRYNKFDKPILLTIENPSDDIIDLYLNGVKYDSFDASDYKSIDSHTMQYDSKIGASFNYIPTDFNSKLNIESSRIELFIPQGFSSELSFAEGKELTFELNDGRNNNYASTQQTDDSISENAASRYLGHWVSFRPTADITDNEDGTYDIYVYWSNSASEGLEWNLKNAVYNSDEDKLSYTDGECVRVVWSNTGEAERTTTDTGLYGYFKLKNMNELSWYDESSGYSSDIVFEKN